MPVHDWTRVEAGIFHHFHTAWITELGNALNGGLLPKDYYALTEQHAGRFIADVLTLHAGPLNGGPAALPSSSGGLALAEAPPKVRRKLTSSGAYGKRRRTLAIRHVSGHRLIAMVEIVSPANKDRLEEVQHFAVRAVDALRGGIHLLLVDLFPPGPYDPRGLHLKPDAQAKERTSISFACASGFNGDARGLHGAVWENYHEEPYELPAEEPLTVVSYAAGRSVQAFVEHLAVGGVLPDMPLFLQSDRYIQTPLENTYQEAYRGVPSLWQEALEGRRG